MKRSDLTTRTPPRPRARVDGHALRAWAWLSLRVSFFAVCAVGLAPELVAFWRIDPGTSTLCTAGFTAFGLLASVSFGFGRALPEEAAATRAAVVDAGRSAFHAAVLSLVALLVVHGSSEGWPGMKLLRAFPPTDVLVRVLVVALAAAASWSGLLAIWRLQAALTAA